MIPIASKLKSEREKRGFTLEQIASETHISLRQLEKIEAGCYGDLPGGIYTRAFLRAYCESIKLDPREIIERYEKEVSPHAEKHFRAGGHVRTGRISLEINPIIIWSFMLLVSATGLFLSRKRVAEIFSPYFSHSSLPGDQYKSLETNSLDSKGPLDFSIAGTTSPPQASLTRLEPQAQTVEASDDKPTTASAENSLPVIRLELAATEQCWVFINRDGTPAVSRLLNPGEVESLGAVEKLFIILGNAGGVDLKINGMPAKQLGKTGEVLRLLITEKSIPKLLDQPTG